MAGLEASDDRHFSHHPQALQHAGHGEEEVSSSTQTHWIGLPDVVAPELKGRVLALASKPKKREKLVSMFAHNLSFDEAFVHPIGKKGTENQVIELLSAFDCPNNVVVLNNLNKGEGEWKPFPQAIADCFGDCSGELVSCLPGKLLFHESEEPEFRAVIYKAV